MKKPYLWVRPGSRLLRYDEESETYKGIEATEDMEPTEFGGVVLVVRGEDIPKGPRQ